MTSRSLSLTCIQYQLRLALGERKRCVWVCVRVDFPWSMCAIMEKLRMRSGGLSNISGQGRGPGGGGRCWVWWCRACWRAAATARGCRAVRGTGRMAMPMGLGTALWRAALSGRRGGHAQRRALIHGNARRQLAFLQLSFVPFSALSSSGARKGEQNRVDQPYLHIYLPCPCGVR